MTDPIVPTTSTTAPTTPPPAPTVDEIRLTDLEYQVACMRRALLSLGSALLAGGAPGGAGYIAWHKDEMVPPTPKPPVNPAPVPAA